METEKEIFKAENEVKGQIHVLSVTKDNDFLEFVFYDKNDKENSVQSVLTRDVEKIEKLTEFLKDDLFENQSFLLQCECHCEILEFQKIPAEDNFDDEASVTALTVFSSYSFKENAVTEFELSVDETKKLVKVLVETVEKHKENEK